MAATRLGMINRKQQKDGGMEWRNDQRQRQDERIIGVTVAMVCKERWKSIEFTATTAIIRSVMVNNQPKEGWSGTCSAMELERHG
jgi:hypothetical protein